MKVVQGVLSLAGVVLVATLSGAGAAGAPAAAAPVAGIGRVPETAPAAGPLQTATTEHLDSQMPAQSTAPGPIAPGQLRTQSGCGPSRAAPQKTTLGIAGPVQAGAGSARIPGKGAGISGSGFPWRITACKKTERPMIRGATTANAPIQVSPGIRGRVDGRLATPNSSSLHIKGKVTDSRATPIAGMEVDAYLNDGSGFYVAYTQVHGDFSVVVEAGTYEVAFFDSSGSYASGWYGDFGFVEDYSDAADIDVFVADATGVNASVPNALTIGGRVSAPGGGALAGIEVDAGGAGTAYYASTTTASDGTYSIAVVPDDYTVAFVDNTNSYASGFYSSSGFVYDENAASPVPVTSTSVTRINMTMPLTLHIKGKVRKAGGTPLANIEVDARTAQANSAGSPLAATGAAGESRPTMVGSPGSAYTAADGSFTIAVVPGTYLLSFYSKSGTYGSGWLGTAGFTYDPGAAAPIVVSTADVTGKDVTLPAAIHITGQAVHGSTGLAGVEVDVYSGGIFYDYGITAPGGAYSVAVAPGAYTISFYDHSGTYATGWYSNSGFTYDWTAASQIVVTVSDGAAGKVSLPAALHITGTITDKAHLGVSVHVTATREDGAYGVGTISGEDGSYSLVVVPGSYTIYLWDDLETYASGYYGRSGFVYDWAAATQVVVTTADVTIGVALPPALQITGKVTDASHAGLAGIAVFVSEPAATAPSPPAWTDDDGRFAVVVTPGTYVASFFDETGTYGSGFYGASGFTYDPAAASAISVTTADRTADVVLPAALHIEGKVTDAHGTALGGIAVDLTVDSIDYNAALTEADGTYSIAAAPGSAMLNFSDESQTYASGWYSSAGFTYYSETAARIAVSASDVTGVNVALPGALHIAGRVTDKDSAGLSGIVVYEDSLGADNSTDYVLTGGGGSYSLVVAPGTYELYFFDPAGVYGSGFLSPSGFTYQWSATGLVRVSSADATGRDVTLPPAIHISGRVANASGVGLRGIRVTPASDDYWDYVDSGAGGRYSIAIRPGTYTVGFSDSSGTYGNGYYAASGFTYDEKAASTFSVTTADVSGKNLTLPRAMHIEGMVSSGGPLGPSDVFVSVLAGDEVYASTETDGPFSLAVAPGSYTVFIYDMTTFYGSGYYGRSGVTPHQAQAKQIIVSESDVAVNATLPLQTTLSGRVGNAGSQGLANIVVTACVDGQVIDRTSTGPDGRYWFYLAPANYTLYFYDGTDTYASGWYSTSGLKYESKDAGQLTLAGKTLASVNLTLPAALQVKGKVTNSGSAGLWGVSVETYSHGILYSVATTDLDGTYSMAVAPGSYLLGFGYGAAYASGWYDGSGFSLDAGQAAPVVVSAASVTGIDVKLPGESLPRAPSGVVAVGRDGSALVSWSSPSVLGGQLLWYTVTSSPGGKTCSALQQLSCTVRGLVNSTAYRFTVTATNPAGKGPASSASAPVAPRVGDTYVPLVPSRVVDSRKGIGLSSPLSANHAASFKVTDQFPGDATKNVPGSAAAVTGVLSVSGSSAGGWLALTPAPDDAPKISTINFPAGDARATGVTVPIGAGGLVSVTYGGAAAGDTAAVAFDVTGYFLAGTAGASYYPLSPNRILDTRVKNGLSAKLTAGVPASFQVTGRTPGVSSTNVPAAAIAVTGTLTVTNQSKGGSITLTPSATPSPSTASLYFPTNDNRATGLSVKLGASGNLWVTYSSASPGATTSVIFDVNGYYLPGTGGAMYVAITPNRLVDSRPGARIGLSRSLAGDVAATFGVTGRVPADATQNVPAAAVAITGTLTVTGQTAAGWIAITNLPNNRPTTSSLNFPLRDNRATGVTMPLSPSGGKLSLTYGPTRVATINVCFDVTGYFVR